MTKNDWFSTTELISCAKNSINLQIDMQPEGCLVSLSVILFALDVIAGVGDLLCVCC